MKALRDPGWGWVRVFQQVLPGGVSLLLGWASCGEADGLHRAAGSVSDSLAYHPLEDVVFEPVVPLPASDTVVLSFHLPERALLEIAILDGGGQVILQPWQGVLAAGAHRLPLDLSTLEAGPWVCTLSGHLLHTRRTFVRAQVVVRQ